MIYLDHAAATPVDSDVLAAMQPFFAARFYNPSATYLPARGVRAALDDARSRVAYWLGVRPSEIIFTAGGTEANNLAIQGVLRKNPNCSVAISAVEHDSVLASAQKYNCSVALVTEQGRVDLNDLRRKITDETVLVSVMYANNEVGTVQPIRLVSQIVSEIRSARQKAGNTTPLYLHTDACQAANYLDLHVSRLGIDMMTLNGGKIYGPKQSGVLYVASHVQLEPLIYGGGQERGLRSGTENVASAVGFAAALDAAQTMRHEEAKRLIEIQSYAYQQISEKLPSAVVNGSIKQRLPNNLHTTLPGIDNERLLIQLEQAGIIAAAGSACSASSDEPSHVLRAMGLSDTDAQSSVRLTMGRGTTKEDIDVLITKLVELTNLS
jgi:cysteine desulfurase